MKIRLLTDTLVGSEPKKKGEELEVEDGLAEQLIGLDRAEVVKQTKERNHGIK